MKIRIKKGINDNRFKVGYIDIIYNKLLKQLIPKFQYQCEHCTEPNWSYFDLVPSTGPLYIEMFFNRTAGQVDVTVSADDDLHPLPACNCTLSLKLQLGTKPFDMEIITKDTVEQVWKGYVSNITSDNYNHIFTSNKKLYSYPYGIRQNDNLIVHGTILEIKENQLQVSYSKM